MTHTCPTCGDEGVYTAIVDGEETQLPCADCPTAGRYGVGTCTDCGNRVRPKFIRIHAPTREPFHTAIRPGGAECGGTIELDQDAELPRHLRAAMAPGQDRIPIGGGQW